MMSYSCAHFSGIVQEHFDTRTKNQKFSLYQVGKIVNKIFIDCIVGNT